ncbi:hypothetical protein PDENDC454_15087 [Paenibacillus dendritiformis C454]|uniref:Uncharacterized protein n=1 Tax=Paenibacillus dendritiformis C454 TaxID=1131935 RepID=H3SHK4_9BACL|nr:hypothetical protein PDENDC454_15087 [Paenibacillus dendritiformis C454]
MKSRATPIDTSGGGDGEVKSMEISAAATNNRIKNGHEMEFRDIRTIKTLLSSLSTIFYNIP